MREEVAALKTHPDVAPHPAALQVSELTLALRRLSEKLTSTEETLLERTTELTHTRSDLHTAQSDSEAAHALTVQAYIQIDYERQRQRELERRVRAAEEERKLADLVVQEYADLVRSLEGRSVKTPPTPHTPATPGSAADSSSSLVNSLAEGKLGLHRLLGEHNQETEKLAAHITKLSDENEFLKTKLDVERKRSEADRESLAKVLLELDKHRIDDSTATKMVSRYMKFSQSTIDSLQQAMENMKTRHAATVATLNAQVDYLQKALSAERRQAEKLRDTLDELSEDINREAYGRRREVALRLSFLSREEGLAENLRRWLRRSRESVERTLPEDQELESKVRPVLENILSDAEALLESLNGQPNVDDDTPASIARLVAAQDAVKSMTKELHAETERRLRLQRQLAEITFDQSAEADDAQNFTLSTPPPRTVSLRHVSKQDRRAGDQGTAAVIEAAAAVTVPAQPEMPHGEQPTIPTANDAFDHTTAASMDSVDTPSLIPTSHSFRHSFRNESNNDDRQDARQAEASDDATVTRSTTETILLTVSESNPPAAGEAAEKTFFPASGAVIEPAPVTLPLSHDISPQEGTETGEQAQLSEAAPGVKEATPVPFPSLVETSALSTLGEVVAIPAVGVIESVQSEVVPGPTGLLFSPAHPPFPPPADSSSSASPQINKQALLTELTKVKSRYRDLQKSFRDCNVTLKDLKKDAALLSSAHEMSSVIRTAIDRLDDYNEDARVELEIRVADEERILTGYETLLSVSGALDEDMDEKKLQEDICAFVDGSDRAVARAMTQFSRKLDDLQHDIASIKKALHEITADADDAARPTTPSKHNASWSTWTAGILGSGGVSRPVSPAPSFGAVMTSPRQRQASFSLKRRPSMPLDAHGRSPSDESADPFTSLGLRIPMPVHVMPTPALPKTGTFLSSMSMSTPLRGPKQRASSASLFALGIGARSSTFSFAAQSPGRSPSTSVFVKEKETKEMGTNKESKESSGGESSSDIE